ncbi:MAG: FUSC family membrane protein [Daejeonella sp.]|uniref:FUSC family protein n=1 Tax=Daejeonella sp. TaxID=2805397 RepID=UPI0027368434|nr:FUSC family membrane protein [Daejeonella sp.]MDP3468209.1 FUSC family membrane protein [Daejeonella sp.]
MKQSREIKTFIFSQYFSEGLRITFGVLLPSLVFFQLDQPSLGLTISLGAFCVSIADNQGPITHKRNGMLFCSILIFLTTLLTGSINKYPFLIGLEILILCFFYSMFSLYGNRASSIGMAALLVMILSIDHDVTASQGALGHALYILSGGIWYMLLSLSLAQFRPYRLAQQAMGECIREVAEYVRLKADFYDNETDFDENYKKLISQQVIVHEQQDSVRELLFKTRLLVKESTLMGRLLILVFVDIIDLFEQTMATHYDYQTLHKTYGKSKSLKEFRSIIIKLSEELENLSYYIISNEMPQRLTNFKSELERLKICIDKVEETGTNAFVLKKILINIRNMVSRVDKIYTIFSQKHLSGQEIKNEVDLSKFVSHQNFDFKILKENLSPKSSIFRHSVRVALMCLFGYLVSKLFPVGYHSYWILLTILVLLKPAYSLTKQRNIERLIGTIIGGIAGALILYSIKDQTALFVFLLIFMVAAYSFQRLNYVVSVLFMTPYILILFSFMGENNINLAQERIIDTFIGSFIALSASYLVLPNWESHNFKYFMGEILIANYQYLQKVASLLSGNEIDITAYKLARKNVYVSSANLGSAFQRMLSEPKSKQQNSKELHKFVVLNHMLSSYTATLMTTLLQKSSLEVNDYHIKLIKRSLYTLSEVIKSMKDVELEDIEINGSDSKYLYKKSNESDLLSEQLELVNKLIIDLQKIGQNQV